MEQVYDVLEVRSVNEASRTFTGVANSPRIDTHQTSILPEGAVFSLPIPLFYHDRGGHGYLPFGNVVRTWIEGGKRWVEAHIPKVDDSTAGGRSVRDRLDAAWAEVKSGLVRGLSIDFLPIDPPRATPGTIVKKWEFRGLTVVPIPSNMDASIFSVRSAFAASGDPSQVPASRAQTIPPRPGKMKTVQEQITQFENTRAAKIAQRDSLMEKSGEEGVTLDASEQETFDTLDTEIRSIDDHLVRLNRVKTDTEKRAVPVVAGNIAAASQARSGVPVVTSRPNTTPGIAFARYAMSLAACGGNRFEAAQYAKRSWGDGADEIVGALENRAAIAAGTTLDATFAAPLVQTNYLAEFLELLRPATLIGRIPGLKRVPFNISMPAQTAGGTYNWVGQGSAKPLTNMAFSSVTLGMAKAAGIIVLTEELVRSSAPSAQEAVRDELIKGITAFLDDQFVDPDVAAVSNVSPASITNGVAGTVASGTTAAAARTDLAGLLDDFATNNYGLSNVVLLMNEAVALRLGMMITTDGSPAFPGILPTGGTLLNMPVVTSNVIGADIFAVHTPSILVADDGGVDVAVSREASLQMDSEPDNPADGDTVYVSMFQRNLVALRGERWINWKKARSTAVTRIHTVAYAA